MSASVSSWRDRGPVVAEALAIAILTVCVIGLHVDFNTRLSARIYNDYAPQFNMAADVYTRLTTPPWSFSRQVGALLDAGREYPPLLHSWTALMFTLFGVREWAVYTGQSILVGMLFLAVYLFMRSRSGRTVAVTGALLVATSPMIALTASVCSSEFVMTLCVFATLALLAANPTFERTGLAVGFGAAAGLGMLGKWTALPYYAPIGAICAARTLYLAPRRARWKALLVVGLALQATLLIPFVVHADPAMAQLIAVCFATVTGIVTRPLFRESLEKPAGNLVLALLACWCVMFGAYFVLLPKFFHHLRDYSNIWWSDHLRVPAWYPVIPLCWGSFPGLSIFLTIGLAMIVRDRKHTISYQVLAIGLFTGLAVTGIMRLPVQARYHAPLVPLATVLATFWWNRGPSWRRVSLVAIGLSLALLQTLLMLPYMSEIPLSPERVWAPWTDFRKTHSESVDLRTFARDRIEAVSRRVAELLAPSAGTQAPSPRVPCLLVVVEPELRRDSSDTRIWKPEWETWTAYALEAGARVTFTGDSRTPDSVAGFRLRSGANDARAADASSLGAPSRTVDGVLLVAPPDRLDAATRRVTGLLSPTLTAVETMALPSGTAARLLLPRAR